MVYDLHMDEFFPKTKNISNETLLKKRTLTMLDQLFVCNIMHPDCPVSHFESKKKTNLRRVTPCRRSGYRVYRGSKI